MTEDIQKLWLRNINNFNDWRRRNDIPLLLTFFKGYLPFFEEWQETNNISDEVFLSSDKTSEFFLKKSRLYYYKITNPPELIHLDNKEVSFHAYEAKDDFRIKKSLEIHGIKSELVAEFHPYFFWLNKFKNVNSFTMKDDPNKAKTNDIRYMQWESGGAKLFYSHKVLFLGGVEINSGQLDGRNLDFVCLDDLMITGDGAVRSSFMTYSSCNRVTFKDVDNAFYYFNKCHIDNLVILNSKLQDLHFINSEIYDPYILNSRLTKMSFTDCIPNRISVKSSDIHELIFNPGWTSEYKRVFDFARRMRVVFQNMGDRVETSKYYYDERYYHMMSELFPLINKGPSFSRERIREGIAKAFVDLKSKEITLKQFLTIGIDYLFKYVLSFTRPLWRSITHKIKCIPDIFSWALWGFGERPVRTIGWMFAVIAIWMFIYFISIQKGISGNLSASLYYSIVTFTTLGYGDIVPNNELRLIAASEALLGALLIALLVAGFANRNRI